MELWSRNYSKEGILKDKKGKLISVYAKDDEEEKETIAKGYEIERKQTGENAKLVGLHPENPKKAVDTPTSERLLKAFSGITLTIIEKGERIVQHLTPLSELQKEILKRLELDSSFYQNLEINKNKSY